PGFETLSLVRGRLRVGQRSVRIHVRGAAHALPVRYRAAGLAGRDELVEATRRAAARMVVACHDDDGLLVVREIPETRQRLAADRYGLDQLTEQAHLLVGLRNGDLREVDPVRLRVAGRGAEVHVVRADRRLAVALRSGPRDVALTRGDERAREIER